MKKLLLLLFLIPNLVMGEAYLAESNYVFTRLAEPIDVSEVNFYHNNIKIKIKDVQKKIIIVNVWATWCVPCLREMPSLDELSEKLDEKNFFIMPLSQDDGGITIVRKYYKKLNIKNLDIFIDSDHEFSNTVFLRGLPSTFIIKKGKVVAKLEGEINWDNEKIINKLEQFY